MKEGVKEGGKKTEKSGSILSLAGRKHFIVYVTFKNCSRRWLTQRSVGKIY